jgi:hypothetical protein
LVSSVQNPAFADQNLDRAEAIGWLIQHQNGDGSWGRRAGRGWPPLWKPRQRSKMPASTRAYSIF